MCEASRVPAPRSLDYEWATRTGGKLTSRQKMLMLGPVVSAVGRFATERLLVALGRRGSGSLDLDALRWPDTALAQAAEVEAVETLTPHVLQHSYRTYLFGRVLAGIDGVAVDEEIGFVSSMLHDLQLESPTPNRCFAVVGAERAERFVVAHGASPERARQIAIAVAGHLTPGAADDLGDPAGFVSAGAFADVAGARLGEMDRRWIADVVARHPRHDFKRNVRAAFRAEAAAVPEGRVKWLLRYAAFGQLARIAPFQE